MRLIRVFACSLSVLFLSGCGGDKSPDILCTTTVVADVVREVAGGHQSIGVLMDADADPHLYDPTPADARKLRGAKVVFYSGLHLEGKMIEMLEDLGKKKPVHALTTDIPKSKLRKTKEGAVDPHVWFDLELWSTTADVAAEALAEYDPKHADDYRANAAAYKKKLLSGHEKFKELLSTIPKKRRVLVTAHDAFSYFGRAYEVEVESIQGISTDDEAGLKEIERLVAYIVDNRIKAVFVETSVSDKNVKALVERCGRKLHDIEIGGMLYSDSLGATGSDTGTLLGAMEHNVDAIVKALK